MKIVKDIIVQKFGGTSVADTEKIKNVAQVILKERNNGNSVVVIVSAMGHTTDHLLKLASEVSSEPSLRELDMLLSTGECVSASLLAMAVQSAGVDSISLNAIQAQIQTEHIHGSARIVDINSESILKHVNDDKVVIITGFQGVASDNEITTLGRGGSDTSAVAVAAAIGAKRCDIYTDVEGVYTTDPRVVPNASKLDEISYEEMLELARVGANVMHPRSVETAKQYNIPLRVRSSFNTDNLGTLILGVEEMEIRKIVTGVAADLSQLRIVVCDVPDIPGHAAMLFDRLATEGISVDMIIQSYARKNSNTNDIAFTVHKNELAKTQAVLEKLEKDLKYSNIHIDANIAKVSIVGAGMIDRPGIAAKMFKTLADNDINIKMISTSEILISCLVDAECSKEAVKALHKAFELESDVIADVKGTLPD